MATDVFRCNVAILAGGKGTRLKARTGNLPKPMAPVLGHPVLEHLIDLCRQHGFTRVALLVHYEHEVIRQHFGDGTDFGVEILYCIEQDARGTAGALVDALPQLDDRFLVLYGDTYLDVDLRQFWLAHERAQADVTLFLHPNDHPQDSDLVEIDDCAHVKAIHAYPHAPGVNFRNLVNAALYVFERKGLEQFSSSSLPSDIARHMFPAMLAAGRRLHGYTSPEYIKDMGTPGRLDRVEADIRSGLVDRLSMRQLREAVFIDRDGTLIQEVGHLSLPEQVELISGTGPAIRALNRTGVLAILATNQPVVARGEVSFEALGRIHARMDSALGTAGAFLDACYVCPHHPDRGFAGEVAELKFACDCRKPATGLIDAACRELQIDRRTSWMVGDTTADIEAGRRAGLRTVLVRTGHAGGDDKRPLQADYEAADLGAAVKWILQGRNSVAMQLAPLLGQSIDARFILIGGLAQSGKSSAAQVLCELASAAGARAHVLSLDAWLRPAEHRAEGDGVLSRFDVERASSDIASIVDSTERKQLRVHVYDRLSRSMLRHERLYSIGRDDIVIVEGVPALLIEPLRRRAQLTLYVEVSEDERETRLHASYDVRGWDTERIGALLASREADEVPLVRESAKLAQFRLISGSAQ